MSRSIPFSEKHGVNPTIPVCFWCGEDKNEIALLGKYNKKETKRTAYGTTQTVVTEYDAQAPMRMVLNYEPCDKCQEKRSQGMTLIEVVNYSTDGRPPIHPKNPDYFPTGRHLVVRTAAMKLILNDDMQQFCHDGGVLLLDPANFKRFIPED